MERKRVQLIPFLNKIWDFRGKGYKLRLNLTS